MFWDLPEVSLLGTIRVFCSNAESRFGCASSRRLRLVLWLFTSCVWVVLGYRIHIKTAFVSWAKQKLSKTTSSTFQKCLFELCSAWFFGCKKTAVLTTCWDLSPWNNTCLLFKWRVPFRLRYFSNATFRTLALHIPRLRCLAIPNTYKNSFWFFRKRGLPRFVLYAIVSMIFVQTFRKILGDLTERKTPSFQNDVEYNPKMSVWALLCFFLWL